VRRYAVLVAGLCAFFLILFGIISAAEVPLLTTPGSLSAAAGVALLIADVVLPVPSSAIMFAFGAAFGLWGGAALSMIGAVGASLAGFALGRGGREVVRRFVRDDEYDRAAALLDRWGTLALIATRPVPILAETVAILAGASRTGWGRMTATAVLGSAVPAILYAWAGSAAREPADGIVIFLLVLAFSGVVWRIGRTRRIAAAQLPEGPG
jgi:uncharacterized membrane protein YdjX (TVP38/TMEM64 family)